MINNFYQSEAWIKLKRKLMFDRRNELGVVICEHCGKPIVKAYDCIGHHKIELTGDLKHDAPIALDPANIALVHHDCHNLIHKKFNAGVTREVWLVWGAPCSGKSSFVNEHKKPGDLILDVDNIWFCLTGGPRFVRPEELKPVMFNVRREIENNIKMRAGKWSNAWVIGSYPRALDRVNLCNKLGAKEIYIDATKEECIERLAAAPNRQAFVDQWKEYINQWFEEFKLYN